MEPVDRNLGCLLKQHTKWKACKGLLYKIWFSIQTSVWRYDDVHFSIKTCCTSVICYYVKEQAQHSGWEINPNCNQSVLDKNTEEKLVRTQSSPKLLFSPWTFVGCPEKDDVVLPTFQSLFHFLTHRRMDWHNGLGAGEEDSDPACHPCRQHAAASSVAGMPDFPLHYNRLICWFCVGANLLYDDSVPFTFARWRQV